jgi:hypothetical protein
MKSKRIQTQPLLIMQSSPTQPNPTQPNRSESTDPPGCAGLRYPNESKILPRHGPKKSATSISTPPQSSSAATRILLHLRDEPSQKPRLPDIPSGRHATVRRTASASFSPAPRILERRDSVDPLCPLDGVQGQHRR